MSEQGSLLKIYIRKGQKSEPLSVNEERMLAARAQRGDEYARERLIITNLRLVIAIALRYRNLGVPIQDLVQEGEVGLLHAIGKYNPKKGTRFSTYASFWIRYFVQRTLEDKGRTVRIPTRKLRDIRRLNKEVESFTAQRGYAPSNDELAEATGWSVQRVETARDLMGEQVSLEYQATPDGSYLKDSIANTNTELPEKVLMNKELAMACRAALAKLGEREALVLTKRYGINGEIPGTLKEIGDEIGLSAEAVRQIEMRAIEKIRQFGRDLRAYL